MQIINLTPHAINIVHDGVTVTLPPSGTVARVATVSESCQPLVVEGREVPTIHNTMGSVTGIPEPQDGVCYLVSGMVLAACQWRPDVFAPDTGSGAIRDEKKVNSSGLRGLSVHNIGQLQ